MLSCCGGGSPSTVGGGGGTGSASGDFGGIFASGSSCGLCLKCFLFWVLAGVLVLILITGRR